MASTLSVSGISQNSWSAQQGIIAPPVQSKFATQTLTANTAVTINKEQSGVLFLLPANGQVITLPAPSSAGPGWNCKFQMIANNVTTAWTIGPVATGTIRGLLINQGVTAITLAGKILAGVDSVTFATGALNGDQISLVCDGTNYSCTSYSSAAGGTA